MFFENLQKTCKEQKTSPSAVAMAIGLSKSNVTHWKNGSVPSGDIIVKLCQHLGVTADALLGNEAPKTLDQQLEGIEFALFGEVKEMTDGQKRDVLKFAQFIKGQSKE